MIEHINIETTILIFGLLILLAGLFGKIESKWFKIGTENLGVRIGAGIIGSVLILYSIIFPQFTAKNNKIAELQEEISIYKNLDEIERRHIDMLQRFMRDHREKIDDFALKIWVPYFLDKVNTNEHYQKDLREAIAIDIPQERKLKQLQQLFIIWYNEVQRQVERRRDKLIEPLYKFEREILRKAREPEQNSNIIAKALDETEELFSIFDQSGEPDKYIDQFYEGLEVINERLKE